MKKKLLHGRILGSPQCFPTSRNNGAPLVVGLGGRKYPLYTSESLNTKQNSIANFTFNTNQFQVIFLSLLDKTAPSGLATLFQALRPPRALRHPVIAGSVGTLSTALSISILITPPLTPMFNENCVTPVSILAVCFIYQLYTFETVNTSVVCVLSCRFGRSSLRPSSSLYVEC